MLEKAYLKNRFGSFPLALFFFSCSPFYPLPCLLLYPCHHPATVPCNASEQHSNNNVETKDGEIKRALTVESCEQKLLFPVCLHVMWNSTLGVSLFKKKTPTMCCGLTPLPPLQKLSKLKSGGCGIREAIRRLGAFRAQNCCSCLLQGWKRWFLAWYHLPSSAKSVHSLTWWGHSACVDRTGPF